MTTLSASQRWLALGVLCLGVLMDVIDTTIVNVALPSIQQDLGFTPSGLAWVVNAYLLTFGGCLLLSGKLGDLYGHRRLFLFGIAAFSLTSLAAGLATGQLLLIAARAAQGIAGAVVAAVSLSLIVDLFPEPDERAKAMGVYGFICAGGGSIGAMLGGLLTDLLNWHWVFLVNLPVGVAVIALSLRLVPDTHNAPAQPRLDIGGALTVTTSLLLAVYAIVNGNDAGWLSLQTMGLLAVAVALFCAFLAIEARVSEPLMPLALIRLRNVATANIVGVLWAAAMFAWFFLSALYLQQVLGYNPFKVGLAFVPANVIMAAFSLGLSARLVTRFGLRGPLAAGLALAGAGLALFARAPEQGSFLVDVLPGMVLLGIGGGMAFNPVLLAAMSDVEPRDSGLASGLVNTAFMMGGALGLAALASLSAARTTQLLGAGAAQASALNAGYHAAFVAGTAFALLAALIGWFGVREPASAGLATQPAH